MKNYLFVVNRSKGHTHFDSSSSFFSSQLKDSTRYDNFLNSVPSHVCPQNTHKPFFFLKSFPHQIQTNLYTPRDKKFLKSFLNRQKIIFFLENKRQHCKNFLPSKSCTDLIALLGLLVKCPKRRSRA